MINYGRFKRLQPRCAKKITGGLSSSDKLCRFIISISIHSRSMCFSSFTECPRPSLILNLHHANLAKVNAVELTNAKTIKMRLKC